MILDLPIPFTMNNTTIPLSVNITVHYFFYLKDPHSKVLYGSDPTDAYPMTFHGTVSDFMHANNISSSLFIPLTSEMAINSGWVTASEALANYGLSPMMKAAILMADSVDNMKESGSEEGV